MRAIWIILALPFICFALAGAGGCDERSGEAGESAAVAESPPIRIVTSVYPLADIARQVGGKRVTVEWLRESGQGPEALEADAARQARLRSADMVVTSSAHPWTLEGSDNAYSTQRVLRVDAVPAAQGLAGDAYLWLHPQVAKDLADALRTRLSALDPKRETFYLQNAGQFAADVDRAIAEHADVLARHAGAPLVSIDPGFAPLGVWAGMSPVRIADSPPRAVSQDVTRRLRDALSSGSDKRAKVFFAGEDTPPAVLRDLESRTGARAIVLDALGTSAPSGRTTYGQLLRYNLDQLSAAAPAATKPSSRATP